MTEEDPDLLAGDNLDELRGRNRYPAMSERFRLTEELENARYQNKLLTEKCRQLEMERDDLRRAILESLHPDVRENYAAAKEWDFPDCFKET